MAAMNGTRYFERYAMLSLQAAYEPRWSDFAYGEGVESPDLQCERLSVGIEVTRAISGVDGLSPEVLRWYLSDEDACALRNQAQQGAAEPRNFRVHVQRLEHSIAVKTEKLNQLYRVFEQNHLYLFCFNPALDAQAVRDAMHSAAVATAHCALHYERLFVNCVNALLVVDTRTRHIIRIELPERLLEELRARAYVV